MNGESFIVCVGVVDEFHVEVGPDCPGHLSSELKHSKRVIPLLLTTLERVLVLELVHEVLVLLGDQSLHLWQALLNGQVPHLGLATEEPLSIFAFDQGLHKARTYLLGDIGL